MEISPVEAAMASIQHLREFIRDRLTAAAEDIFSEFEKTIVQYERQRELQDITWNPVLKLQRTGESDCATGVCLNPEREREGESQQRTGREANGRRPESAKNKLEARVRHICTAASPEHVTVRKKARY